MRCVYHTHTHTLTHTQTDRHITCLFQDFVKICKGLYKDYKDCSTGTCVINVMVLWKLWKMYNIWIMYFLCNCTLVNIWSGSKPFIKVDLKPKCILFLGQLWLTFLIHFKCWLHFTNLPLKYSILYVRVFFTHTHKHTHTHTHIHITYMNAYQKNKQTKKHECVFYIFIYF